MTLCYHWSLLTLSAKASCGVPFTQTGLSDLLLKTGGDLDEREKKKRKIKKILLKISNKLINNMFKKHKLLVLSVTFWKGW